MRKQFLIIIIIALYAPTLSAQPEIDRLLLFDRDGTPVDFFADVYFTEDENYLICGQSAYNPWIIKTDPEGEVLWEYAEVGVRLFSVIEADNGDAVTVGSIGDPWMFGAIRLDFDGELVWRREYLRARATAVIELKNNNFLICGRGGHVIMINPDGDVIWRRQYGVDDNESYFEAMRETDGGVVLAGWISDDGRLGWIVKIDHEEEGDVIWSRLYDAGDNRRSLHFRSIVSTNFGFAVGGTHSIGGGGFALYFVNRNGQLIENHLYENSAWFECLNKLSDGGFILVGYNTVGRTHYPIALRVGSEGDIRWTNNYSEIVDEQPEPQQGQYLYNQFYSVIVQPRDVIVACGVMYNNEVRENLEDGLLMRLEPDQLQPIIFYWFPEDTVFTALRNDSTEFIVRARDQQGDELGYEWWSADTLMSRDTTVTVVYEEAREYNIQCRVSDDDWTTAINWRVNVADFYIDSYQPDTLNIAVRRNTIIDFSASSRAVEGEEFIEYLWLLDDLEIADNDSVSIVFEHGREHEVEVIASLDDLSDNVVWQVLVNDLIVDYMPHQLELSVPVDTSFEFEVFPFDPEDDSLTFLWTLNGDSISDNSWVLVNFDDYGLYNVTAYVSDTTESDSLTWEVNVTPNAVNPHVSDYLPDIPTLYAPSPNPFNSQTTVRYAIPTTEHVSLELFDLNGRLVNILINQCQTVGRHETVIDGSGLVSGVYFARMITGNQVQIQKVLLVR